MSGGTFSRLARVRFTVGYVAVLLVVSVAILGLAPHAREAIIQRASTNLHNLAHGHIGTLLGSAVVVDAGPIYFWL
ncbi:MAG: rhomboid-like protein, partial [Mycobacterium sp.]